MELKRDFVYDVIEDGRNLHPIVVMDDTLDKDGCIKGVAFTHNEEGSEFCKNILLPKEYVVESDSNGNRYEFQWEETDRGRTSIIRTGFLKSLEIVEPKVKGQIKEQGLVWIEEQVKGIYDMVKGSISKHCINRRTGNNKRDD